MILSLEGYIIYDYDYIILISIYTLWIVNRLESRRGSRLKSIGKIIISKGINMSRRRSRWTMMMGSNNRMMGSNR